MRNDRTFSRDDWLAAKESWSSFGHAWHGLRQRAALNGMIFAPSGTAHDDRDAESPSQRAIVYRALQDNPGALYAIVGRSRSWFDVVDRVIGLESRLREDADLVERNVRFDKEREPDEREAVVSLKYIVDRLAAS